MTFFFNSLYLTFKTGVSSVLDSSDKNKAKQHGLFMISIWGFVVPIAIVAKRFISTTVSIGKGKYPIGFLIHAVLLTVSGAATIASVILASMDFDSGVKKGHKVIGYIIAANGCLQILMGIFRPGRDAPGRQVFNIIHQNLGRVTWILSIAQIFIGVNNYDRIYGEPDTPFSMAIAGSIFGGISFMVVLAHRLFVDDKKPEQLASTPIAVRRSEETPAEEMVTQK